jgi:hypothetical protein
LLPCRWRLQSAKESLPPAIHSRIDRRRLNGFAEQEGEASTFEASECRDDPAGRHQDCDADEEKGEQSDAEGNTGHRDDEDRDADRKSGEEVDRGQPGSPSHNWSDHAP